MSHFIRSQPIRFIVFYALIALMWLIAAVVVVVRFRQPLTIWYIVESVGLAVGTSLILLLVHYRFMRQQATTESALGESQRTFATLMSNLPGMVYRCENDEAWTMKFISEGSLALTGYTPEQLLASQPVGLLDLIPPGDRPTIRRTIDESLQVKRPFELVYRIRTASGEEKWVWEQGRAVQFGDRLMLEGFVTDITPQQRANDDLRESEARYRLLAENAQDMIYRYNVWPNRGFDYISPAVRTITGYTPEEVYAFENAPQKLIHPDDIPLIASPLGEAVPRSITLRMLDKEGRAIWVEMRNTPFYNDEGRLIAMEGIARDVTAERQIEAALRESEAHLQSIFDGSAIGIMRMDLEGRLLQTNRALQSMLQYSAEELYLRPLADLLPEEAADQWQDLFSPLASGQQEEYRVEKPYRCKDGHSIWCRATRSLVRDAQGQPAFVIGMLEDITEQRLAEQALAQRTKEITQLYELSKQLGQILQLDELYSQVYQAVSRLMDCDSLILSTYDPSDNLIRCIYLQHEGVVVDPSQLPAIPLEPEGAGTQSVAIRTGESLLLNDYQAHWGTTNTPYYVDTDGLADPGELLQKSDMPQSALIIPLKREGRVGGVLQVMSYRLDAYSETDYNILNALAPQIGIALQNAMLFQQAEAEIAERKRAEEAEHAQRTLAEALRDSAAALNESLDLEDVLDRILSNVGQVVPHEAAYILLMDEGKARVVRSWGFAEHGAGKHVPMLEAAFTELFSLGMTPEVTQPLVVSDIHHYERWATLPVTNWARAYASAPLALNQKVVGSLGVLSAKPGFFTETDGDRLRAFADQAAIAIDNARLYDEINLYARDLEQRVLLRTEELQRAKERLEAILDNATEIIMLLSPDGTIEQANRMLMDAFEIEEHECVGKPLTCIAGVAQADRLAKALQAVTIEVRSQRLELMIQSKRETFEAEITLTPIVKSGGLIAGIVCNVHDITSHKEIERQLRQTIDNTNQLNEMKSRFVSVVSHEFRTPLAVIQTALDLLARYEERLTAEQKVKEQTRIRTAIRNMVALLDNVLVYSRGEDRYTQVSPRPIDLEVFIRELIDELKHSVGAAHTFVMNSDGKCINAEVDPRLLRHIMINLLSNAVKYSPPGSAVTVNLHCGTQEAQIILSDQGIGIPSEDQKHLFEPFHRAGNAIEIKGTGLGLAIVKQSVELHRGTIRFESAEGTGTTFYIRLPYLTSGMLDSEAAPLERAR